MRVEITSELARHMDAAVQVRRKRLLRLTLLALVGPGSVFGLALAVVWALGDTPVTGALVGFGVLAFFLLALWSSRCGPKRLVDIHALSGRERSRVLNSEQELTAPSRSQQSETGPQVAERRQAEESLKNSEERFRLIFEYAPVAYYLNDFNGVFVDGNKAAEALIGYPKEELIGKSFLKLDLLPPRQIPKAAALLAKNLLGQPTGPDEFTLRQRDGGQVTAEVSTFPVEIKGQTLVLGIARDVTEPKRVEEALRRAHDELEVRVEERTAELARANESLLAENEERAQAEAKLLQRNRELLSLQSAAAATVSSLDLPFVLETVTWEMVNLLRVEGCTISEWDQEANTLSVIAEYGATSLWEENRPTKTYALTNYPVKARVLVERYAQQITFNQSNNHTAEFADMQATNVKALLMLPMIFQARVVGLVELKDSRVERAITDHEISLAQLLANQAASAIENARLFRQAQQEIAERKQAEEQIKASLEEKEVLLQEIHHRVKNNLQVVSSLLNLQSHSIQDLATVEIFQESQNRILSMALIHEKLYRSHDLARIDLAEYIRNLATDLMHSYRAHSGPVALKIDASDVFLTIEKAVPCGLIINELVSNALKHAFPDNIDSSTRGNGKENEIRIHLSSDQERNVTLIVSDNGVGFPEDGDLQSMDSLGLRLITTLTDQLEGTADLNINDGTEFKLMFTTSQG